MQKGDCDGGRDGKYWKTKAKFIQTLDGEEQTTG